jgi:putative NIF3 family GTP cyclohydrolase 1 type 2
MLVSELSEYLRARREGYARHLGQDVRTLDSEERIGIANEDVKIRGLLVTWMANVSAIRAAASAGCNIVLAHEAAFHRGQWCKMRGDFSLFHANLERERLLKANGIGVFQCHNALDEFLITDCFAELLGLPPASFRRWRLESVHDIPAVPLGTFAQLIMERMKLDSVRVVGDPDRLIRRVALAYGGLGLWSNLGIWEDMLDLSPELFIGGEIDEQAMHYVEENGFCAIETGHAISEEPGIERLALDLRKAFPCENIIFHRCKTPWSHIAAIK